MSNNTAVLIIDMQKDFFKNEELTKRKGELIKNINQLIKNARKKNILIIWIRQIHKKDLSDLQKNTENPKVIEGTEGAELLDGLTRKKTDYEIKKTNYSGFFKTELGGLLKKNDINNLIVCGINTHACVRTTVIDAYQRNFDIIVAKDCVGSYQEDHHNITMRYFEPKIAKIMSNEEVFRYLLTDF